jgi:hypothetical protein
MSRTIKRPPPRSANMNFLSPKTRSILKRDLKQELKKKARKLKPDELYDKRIADPWNYD